MDGRISLVTGATSGIGRVAAEEIARQGSTAIVVGRSEPKCIATVAEIREATGSENVEYIVADLSSMAEVRRLAEQFLSRYKSLHVLLNNAGVSMSKRVLTVDGFESTFAVNHLSHFLLTNLLLPTVKRSAPARIINVSSAIHTRGKIDFDNLQGEKRYGGMSAYGQSKLANVLFTYELARRLEGTGVTVNAVHPGFVRTNLSSNTGGAAKMAWSLITRFALTPQQGAETLIYLATSPEVQNTTGRYFVKKKPVETSETSYDQDLAQRLWETSVKLTGLNVTP
jgi:NAD(P)-dependent dehydrogenase (short-subunit alcohol dehydrogenase family)